MVKVKSLFLRLLKRRKRGRDISLTTARPGIKQSESNNRHPDTPAGFIFRNLNKSEDCKFWTNTARGLSILFTSLSISGRKVCLEFCLQAALTPGRLKIG